MPSLNILGSRVDGMDGRNNRNSDPAKDAIKNRSKNPLFRIKLCIPVLALVLVHTKHTNNTQKLPKDSPEDSGNIVILNFQGMHATSGHNIMC